MKHLASLLAGAALLGGCIIVNSDGEHEQGYVAPDVAPLQSGERLRAPLSNVDGTEVIISDVTFAPGADVPRHYHPGEEFAYLLEGSVIHIEDGKPDRIVKAGEALVIAPEAVHAPRAGPDGARAVVFRVHEEGRPERILVD